MSIDTTKYEGLSEEIKSLFLFDAVQAGRIPEEIFEAHVAKAEDESYIAFVRDLQSNPATSASYGFIVAGGPDAIYGLLSVMGQHGIVDKARTKSAAKITATSTRKARPYWKDLSDELITVGYAAMEEAFTKALPTLIEKHPEFDGVENFQEFVIGTGRKTLGCKVAEKTHEKTDTKCPLALTFRVDYNQAKRNGHWDPETGEFTQDYYDKQEAKAKKGEEDASDDDSVEVSEA